MTEGISKEYLEGKLLQAKKYNDVHLIDLLKYLISQCTELDPWIPIDENTPKDKPIHLFYPSVDRQLIHKYCNQNAWGLYVEFNYVHPTHYKLLSPMPPTEQPNPGPKAPGAEIGPRVV